MRITDVPEQSRVVMATPAGDYFVGTFMQWDQEVQRYRFEIELGMSGASTIVLFDAETLTKYTIDLVSDHELV